MIQHLILRPGAEPMVETAPLTYNQIVDVVGYPVEVINIDGGRAVMYVNEEGRQNGEDDNPAATLVARASLRDDDHVVGTALIVGPLGAGGVDTSLPDETLNDLLTRINGHS